MNLNFILIIPIEITMKSYKKSNCKLKIIFFQIVQLSQYYLL